MCAPRHVYRISRVIINLRVQKVRRLLVENKWLARRTGGCVYTARRKRSLVLWLFVLHGGTVRRNIIFGVCIYGECIVFLLQPSAPFSFRRRKSLFYGKHATIVRLWKLATATRKYYSRGPLCARVYVCACVYNIVPPRCSVKNVVVVDGSGDRGEDTRYSAAIRRIT